MAVPRSTRRGRVTPSVRLQEDELRDGRNVAWISSAVVAGGEVVGDLTLNVRSEEHGGGELGFIVHPRHQGKGYATEAARALLRSR